VRVNVVPAHNVGLTGAIDTDAGVMGKTVTVFTAVLVHPLTEYPVTM
jgi:hypothetical protein